MSTPLRKISQGAFFIGITCLVAVGGYVYAGWGWLESIYMVVITIFGVGYGEVRPIEDPRLIVFTIVVILAGCSAGIYVVGGFVQMVAEGEINRVLADRRKSRGIESMASHVIVCGFGRVGRILARELSQANQQFLVVDVDEQCIRDAEACGYHVLQGDASDEDLLIQAGVDRARVLATVLSNDAQNVFITLTARGLNADLYIVARGESPSTEKKLLRSGADEVVLPAAIGAVKISNLITRPSAEQMLMDGTGQTRWNEELRDIGLEIAEIPLEPSMTITNMTVRDVEDHGQGGFILVAIKRADGTFIKNPNADDRLLVGDRCVILGHQEDLPQLVRFVTKKEAGLVYRGVRA